MLNEQVLKSYYTVEEIKRLPNSEIINNIKFLLEDKINNSAFSEGQIISWNKSIDLIKSVFEKNNKYWNIIFEFLIPLSSGKRPDILLINGATIFLIEVKNKTNYTIADLDQISNYKLELEFYHSTARFFDIKPILLLLKSESMTEMDGETTILSPGNLKSVLVKNHINDLIVNPGSLNDGIFKPIPSISEYAKNIFDKKEIKNIEKTCFINSSLINIELDKIINNSRENKEHAIVFINGLPGSGKSAIGLKCSFDNDGLYLTKNRQFAENLVDEIGCNSSIKSSHNFMSEYAKQYKEPNYNVVVFDEAQRFWNSDKMHKYFNVKTSESQTVVNLFANKDWCVLIVLVGKGQELGWGEYGNLSQWFYPIIDDENQWTIYGSVDSKKDLGYSRKYNFIEKNNFDLVTSFRNFKTPDLPIFINNLLDFEGCLDSDLFKKLQNKYSEISKNGFKIYISRDENRALDYCKSRYKDYPNSYCYITSSEGYINNEENISIDNKFLQYDFTTSSKLNINHYFHKNGKCDDYNNNIIPLDQFSAIGFETQMPIIAWGFDYLWYKDRWNYEFLKYVTGGTEFRQNTYRILLTRGRDGVILFFPKGWQFDKTFNLFKSLGATSI